MRKYRCPWCGEECLTLMDKMFVGHGSRRHYHWKPFRWAKCPRCGQFYGQKHGVLRFLEELIVLVVVIANVFIIVQLQRNGFTNVGFHFCFFFSTLLLSLFGIGFYNYFHAQFARVKDKEFVWFDYQGYMKITLTDKTAKRYLADGATLAVCYEHKKAESEQDMIFPIRLSKKVQKYKPGLWEWGYLNPEKVPDELFQEGRGVVIIDNGREVAKGLVTSVFEDFEKDEPAEDAE